MRRWRWLALLGLALLAGLARTSPVDPEKPSTIEMAGAGKIITVVPCKGNEPTIVIAATTTETGVLSVYVYDARGNCIARDEFSERPSDQRRRAKNDCFVEWVPPAAGTYTVEIRNQSLDSCKVQMTIQ